MCRPVLEGEFVRLRPIVVDDANITLSWRQSERANLLNDGAQTLDQQERWIAGRPASELNFIIELIDSTPVGMLSLIDVNHTHRRAEPSRFLIGESVLVKGIPAAVEAMLLLYRYAFDVLELQRLYGTVTEKNKLMYKWQRFLGMKEEGRLRNHLFLAGEFQDAICLGLTYEDYWKISLPKMNALIKAGKQIN